MATVRITWAAFALATVLPLPALDRPSSQQEKSLRDLLPVADLREPTELYDWVAYCPENFNFSFDLQRAQAAIWWPSTLWVCFISTAAASGLIDQREFNGCSPFRKPAISMPKRLSAHCLKLA